MLLEDYFDFLDPLDVRVRGTRMGIETILREYLVCHRTAEQIAARYRALTPEQVYATLTYYWRNRRAVEAYLAAVQQEITRQHREQEANPAPGLLRLRALAAEQDTFCQYATGKRRVR